MRRAEILLARGRGGGGGGGGGMEGDGGLGQRVRRKVLTDYVENMRITQAIYAISEKLGPGRRRRP